MDLSEKKLASKRVFDGKLLHIDSDTVQLPNGKEATREVIRHCGAVAVVPMLDDGSVVMVRQFRYPYDDVMLEVPAGKLDAGETPLEAAERELSEETGARAECLVDLGKFYPSVAYTDETITIYLAYGLTFETAHTDADEFLETERIPLDTLAEMVMANEIPDGKTQVAILKAKRYLETHRA